MFADVDVIPVVRGGGDYRKLFPPGFYVNAEDFETPESLGKYLNRLSRDKSAYIRMLQHKNRYKLAISFSDVDVFDNSFTNLGILDISFSNLDMST